MKRMDFLCTSPASTAVCSSLDHRSVRHGTRPVYRSNSSKYYALCSASQPPHTPKSFDYERTRNVSAKTRDSGRKSSDDASDMNSPYSSDRYLLSDEPYNGSDLESENHVSELVHSRELVRVNPRHTRFVVSKSDDLFHGSKSGSLVVGKGWNSESEEETRRRRIDARHASNHHRSSSNSSSSARPLDQVVVLRVSIHCKGCEGKVRKHISKMEGVTSFSIDLATKKVTIKGKITPLGVVESLSKVKNAQLWPSPTPSSWST